MTWIFVLFLLGLFLSAALLSFLTVQINAFEAKLNELTVTINNRYDLEALRIAIETENRKIEEKSKQRNAGIS